jgi:hypothetical protein
MYCVHAYTVEVANLSVKVTGPKRRLTSVVPLSLSKKILCSSFERDMLVRKEQLPMSPPVAREIGLHPFPPHYNVYIQFSPPPTPPPPPPMTAPLSDFLCATTCCCIPKAITAAPAAAAASCRAFLVSCCSIHYPFSFAATDDRTTRRVFVVVGTKCCRCCCLILTGESGGGRRRRHLWWYKGLTSASGAFTDSGEAAIITYVHT